jgi:hypothetical protein
MDCYRCGAPQRDAKGGKSFANLPKTDAGISPAPKSIGPADKSIGPAELSFRRAATAKEFSPSEERAICIQVGGDYRVVNTGGSILRIRGSAPRSRLNTKSPRTALAAGGFD